MSRHKVQLTPWKCSTLDRLSTDVLSLDTRHFSHEVCCWQLRYLDSLAGSIMSNKQLLQHHCRVIVSMLQQLFVM